MKLVLATPLYPPEIGGPATYAKALVDGLPSRGIEVELVKFSDVRHLPKLVRHFAYYRRVRAAARAADGVLALDPVSVGLPAMRAAKSAQKPFFVKVVGDYAWEQGRQRFGVAEELDEFVKTAQSGRVRLLQKIQTRVAAAATRVIVPSDYLKRIVTAWGIPAEKIEVIVNAMEKMADPGNRTALRHLLNFKGRLIVSVGRLVPWKGFDALIETLPMLTKRFSDLKLFIIGDGPDRARLGDAARRAGVESEVIFAGRMEHDVLLRYLRVADVFALNSTYEGLSHLLLEAMAVGVPVVTTTAGGNREVIEDGVSGLLVPPGDTVALQKALERVFADAALAARLVAGAHKALERFSPDAMLDATAALLKSV